MTTQPAAQPAPSSSAAPRTAPAKRKPRAASGARKPAGAVATAPEVTALVPTQRGPVDSQIQPLPAAPVAAAPPVQQQAVPTQVNVQVSAPAAPQIVVQVKERGLLVRALYYVFIGWWLSGLLMFAAGVCIASVVLLPVGLALVNRLPQVMTLRPRSTVVNAAMLADGSMQYTVGSAEQRSMLVRTVYFCFVGWWAGMFVMFAAWVLSVLIVTMPLGLMLLNRVPAAVTLRRN